MKLIELEINNVRGIHHISIEPLGNNFVIWGPNGTGKSAVIDAIDFLLTGQISRLMGQGTGGITLSKHGPQIDKGLDEASVRAKVQLPVINSVIEIERRMNNPGIIFCDDKSKDILELILGIAQRGQHVLTRRELLRFITSEASTRAQQIQHLLNIEEIENIRKSMVRVRNDFEKDLNVSKRQLETEKGKLNATAQEEVFDTGKILSVINKNRAILGGKAIDDLNVLILKKEINAPKVISKGEGINISIFSKDLENIRKPMTDALLCEKILSQYKELLRCLGEINSNPEMALSFKRQSLIEMGLKLVDDSGNCPLCDTVWPLGKLEEYLKRKLSSAEKTRKLYDKMIEATNFLRSIINTSSASIQKVNAVIENLKELKNESNFLTSWTEELIIFSELLENPLEHRTDKRFAEEKIANLLAPAGIEKKLKAIFESVKKKYPKSTPEQTAWDTLTRFEGEVRNFDIAEKNYDSDKLAYERAYNLFESFQKARDAILGNLYDEVRDKFVSNYRKLHKSDESGFTAKLEPKEAGLNFEVDFFGRGVHPPHALHSEGHQDSMGLCLYLALNERLTKGLIDMVLLDDVVMSVDSDHRRDFCELLATSFPDRQFIITTHDKTWANQLKSEGVVSKRGFIGFYNWSIEAGPQVNYEIDMWDNIEIDLQKSDIPGAAAKLRRGLEEFFGAVCDAIEAPIQYKLNQRWELGDFLPAAMGKFRKLLKQAKSAAQSWKNIEIFDDLVAVENLAKKIYVKTYAEQWSVNANVHYNTWANFSINDFKPIVYVFQELQKLFLCPNCESLLRLAKKGNEPITVRCNCTNVGWNLVAKAG